MAGWLQSVNNLLENLDGQAENVAETVADVNTARFGQLLQTGRQVVTDRLQQQQQQQQASFDEDEDEDEDEYYDEDEEYFEDDFEEDHAAPEDIDAKDEKIKRQPSLDDALQAGTEGEDSVDVAVPVQRKSLKDDATVSDISFSDYSDDDEDHEQSAHKKKNQSKKIIDTRNAAIHRNNTSATKNTREPAPKQQNTQMNTSAADTATKASSNSIPRDSQRSMGSSAFKSSPSTLTKNRVGTMTPKSMSPKIDESPRPPRRSVDSRHMPFAGPALLEENPEGFDESNAKDPLMAANTSTHSGSAKFPLHGTAPPRPPARQASFPNHPNTDPVLLAGVKVKTERDATDTSKPTAQSPPPPPPPPRSTPIPATTPIDSQMNSNAVEPSSSMAPDQKAKVVQGSNFKQPSPPLKMDPTKTKEYLRLKEKFQALHTKHIKAANEFKTGQTEIKSLQAQIQALTAKLEAANTEIHAQSDELRRAGERMEEERRRATEEREDLLDEQEEELEQLKAGHQKEMDSLRQQYERQIADVSNQLENEESRRLQEGGDYTQELQDAIQRERDALKRLNEETNAKSQLELQLSQMETQQTSLQSKLDTALQAVKTASEREREAQDKLDATLSLHARQLGQRQVREAELEKTVLDLGAALTVAQQKASQASTMRGNAPSGRGKSEIVGANANTSTTDSFKEQYLAATDDLENLKVQYALESQRREALQTELNDISQERASEIATARARQQQHDRTVADLEAKIARLQGSIRDQKDSARTVVSEKETNGMSPEILSQDLKSARSEIKGLSSQLLRQQGIVEKSKAEILALKGRLQAATSRAEQAERSLQTAQATRFTSELGNGGRSSTGMRRRIKGNSAARNRTRTIRAALQMSPGRTNHPFMEQVAMTFDALDAWMVDTGSFMKHEPLARLGFMMYLVLLHVWSFALVIFHTTEQPHGDFGSMDNNPRHWRAAVAAVQQQEQEDAIHH